MSASLFPGLITVVGLLIVLLMAYRTLFQVRVELKAHAREVTGPAKKQPRSSRPHPAE